MTLRFRCVLGSYLGLGARSGNTNSESFMFQRIMLPYVVRVPSAAARTRASSPGAASAAPARDSFTVVTDTLSVERVLTPKALKGKLKRTRPRGNTEAPAGARGAKHCTVWMGVPVHFLRNRATFSPRSASILNLCTALRALPWARCAQLVGPGAGGGVGNSPSVLRRRPSADGKRLYV